MSAAFRSVTYHDAGVTGTDPSMAVTCGSGRHLWSRPSDAPAWDALLLSYTGRLVAQQVGSFLQSRAGQPSRMWVDHFAWLGGKAMMHNDCAGVSLEPGPGRSGGNVEEICGAEVLWRL